MKCDWCQRSASNAYPTRGYVSEGLLIRGCRAHAGIAEAAATTARPPKPQPMAVESCALFDVREYARPK